MPVVESAEYERFSYDDMSASSLTLDEAVKKAADLRRSDAGSFYRIRAIDQGANAFRVEQVPISSAYAEFMARAAKTLARYSRVPKKI